MVTKNAMDKQKCFYAAILHTLISFTQKAASEVGVILTADPPGSDVLGNETVHLNCTVEGAGPYSRWNYTWKKLRAAEETALSSHTGEGFSVYTLSRVKESDSAQYWCEVQAGNSSAVSMRHLVNVYSLAVLTMEPDRKTFSTTEQVTLSCEIHSNLTDWGYLWYKDDEEIPVSTAAFTIHSVSQSDSGTYTCWGKNKIRSLYTASSNALILMVSGDTPKPLLTLDPPSGEIFTGDTVTLSCRAGTDPAGWEYLWYKETQRAALSSTDSSSTDRSSYSIISAALSHAGEYWCRAERGRAPLYTPYSDSLQLNITARPWAVVTLETAWIEIFSTDSLTLRCQVDGSSAEWNYTWYRDGQRLHLDPSEDRLTLTSANDSYRSEYTCRGNRAGRPSYTEISEGCVPTYKISYKVEVLARIAVGAAILIFLSVIVNEAFWRRLRNTRRCSI